MLVLVVAKGYLLRILETTRYRDTCIIIMPTCWKSWFRSWKQSVLMLDIKSASNSAPDSERCCVSFLNWEQLGSLPTCSEELSLQILYLSLLSTQASGEFSLLALQPPDDFAQALYQTAQNTELCLVLLCVKPLQPEYD